MTNGQNIAVNLIVFIFCFTIFFFRSLARKSGENRPTACHYRVYIVSDTMCKSIEFERIVNNNPSGNKWCIESKRKREADEGRENNIAAATSMRDTTAWF